MRKLAIIGVLSCLAGVARADITAIVTSPAGGNGDVQFNKNRRFGADPGNISYSTTTKVLSVPGVSLSTLTAGGQQYRFPSTQTGGAFLRTDGAGGLTWQSPTTTLTSTGTALATFDGDVRISSPTSGINFNGPQFIVSLQGTTTSFVSLDPSIVTLLGSSIDLSSEVNGSLPAASIAAGNLGPAVVASSIAVGAVQDSAIVGVSGSKVSGNITGNAVGITGSVNVGQVIGAVSVYSATSTAAFPFGLSASTISLPALYVTPSSATATGSGGFRSAFGITTSSVTASTVTLSGQIVFADGTLIRSTSTLGGGGGSGGVTVYSATATAAFPFGLTASTGVFTRSLDGNSKSVIIASGSLTTGFYSDPDYYQIFNTNNTRGCIGFYQSDDSFSTNPPWTLCRSGHNFYLGVKSVTGGIAPLVNLDSTGSFPTGSTVTIAVPLITQNGMTAGGYTEVLNGIFGAPVGRYVATFSTTSGGPFFVSVSTLGITTIREAVISSGSVTGTLTAGSVAATGLTAGQCVQTGAGGLLTVTGSACSAGGGGGGSSSLQVTRSGVQITSPTASINFYSGDFGGLAVGSTAQITLNPATTDFVHNQTTAQSATLNVDSGTFRTELDAFTLKYSTNVAMARAPDGTVIMSMPDTQTQYNGYGSALTPLGGATFNTCDGTSCMAHPGTSSFSSCYGNACMSVNTLSGQQDNCQGYACLGNLTSGSFLNCSGGSCMLNTTTANNSTCMGTTCLRDNNGDNNTGNGMQSGMFSSDGTSNLYDGYQAGVGTAAVVNANIHGSRNVYAGAFSGQGVSSNTTINNAAGIGYSALVVASDTMQLGGRLGSGFEQRVFMTSATVNTASLNVNGVSYLWPSSQAANQKVLTNNGSGSLSWGAEQGIIGTDQLHVTHGPGVYGVSASSYMTPGVSIVEVLANETEAQVPYRTPGVLSRFWAMVNSNNLSQGATLQVRINGANGNEVLYIPAGVVGEFQDLLHTDMISAGDKVDFQIKTNTGTGSLGIVGVSNVFTAATGSMMKFVPAGQPYAQSTNGFATYFEPISGWLGSGANFANQTESVNSYQMKSTGTFSNLAMYVNTNARVGTTTLRFRKNGANGKEAISIGAGQTGLFEDLISSDPVVAGDTVTIALVMDGDGGAGQFSASWAATEFRSLDNVVDYIGSTQGHAFSPADANFMAPQGALGFDSAETNDYQVRSQVPVKCRNLHVFVQSNTLNQAVTIRFRKNHSDGNQVITIPAATAGYFEDITHTDLVMPSDEIDYKETVPAGSGSAPFNYIAMACEPAVNTIDLATQVTGTLPATNFPALTGDVTTTAGSVATTLAATIANQHTWTGTATHSSSVTVNSAAWLGANGSAVTISSNTILVGATFYQNGVVTMPGPVTLGAVAGNSVTISSNAITAGATFYQNGTIGLNPNTFSASLPLQTDAARKVVSLGIDLSGSQATNTLAAARMPALTGDVTTSAGAVATTMATTIANTHNFTGAITLGGNGNAVTISSNAVMVGATFYQNGPVVFSTITFSSGTLGILGTTTNNNANVGIYGEYKSSNSLTTNFPTTNAWGDLASITLTAGDWDLTAAMDAMINGATITAIQIGISSTTGNSAAGLVDGDSRLQGTPPTANYFSGLTIPNVRATLSSTTTYFLKYLATYTAGSPQSIGRLSARRVR